MKKTALTTLQVVITFGVFWLLLRDPAKRAEMGAAIGRADPAWLIVGLCCYAFVELAAGVRWQLLLRVQGINLAWTRLFALFMIGIFFNFFVPGGTGGDVVKVFYLLKETPGRRTHALLSVLVDRVIGLFSLIALGGVIVLIQWRWLTDNPATSRYVLPAVLVLAISFIGIGISFCASGFGLARKLPARMPGRDKLAELELAYNLYARAWRTSLIAFVISVVGHFGYFAVFWCAARALHAPDVHIPTFGELCTIMPIVNTISSLPISFGGLGVREGLFQIFLSNLSGVTEAVAVSISLTGYLLTLACGLVGGVVYAFYRPTEHAKLSKMTAEVAAFEHEVAEEEIATENAAAEKAKR